MPVILLERATHLTPLGVRCEDQATHSVVSSGLSLIVTPVTGLGKPQPAFLTPSGTYAFRGLPGLREAEYPPLLSARNGMLEEESNTAINSPPLSLLFALMVEDLAGRFLPWGGQLLLPHHGVLTAPLFSAPTRPSLTNMAVLRGALADGSRPPINGVLPPASYARITAEFTASHEITSPPTVYQGLADARGQFALFLPYPNPLRQPDGVIESPNTRGRRTLPDTPWPLRLSFFYEPSRQRLLCLRPDEQIEIVAPVQSGAGSPAAMTERAPPPGARCVPDVHSLFAQGAARVFRASTGGVGEAAHDLELYFGRETVVRTTDSSATDRRATLRLLPA